MHVSSCGSRAGRPLAFALGSVLFALIGSGAAAAQAAPKRNSDAKPGAVFSMTNDPGANAITTFRRAPNGTLARLRDSATGGTGTGTPEDSANGLVLANRSGESSPTNLGRSARFLLAANGGSDTVTVFRNRRAGLARVDIEDSGGARPISITARGLLTPIPGSTRALSGLPNSGCTQVAFDKTATVGGGSSDVTTSANSRYLYVKSSLEGTVTSLRITRDGSLVEIDEDRDASVSGSIGIARAMRTALGGSGG